MTEYWKNRFLKSTKDIFESNEKYVAEIFRMYKRASESIDRDILSILNSMNQVNMSEAKKLLNKKEIKGLKNNLEDFMNASKGFITPDIERELDLVSRRVRISKLQGLELSLKSKAAVLLNEEQKKLFAHLSNQYVSSYYKDLYGLQRITGYKNINKLSKNFVEEVLNTSWANDGKNFSERIWKRKDKLISSLDTDLRQGLIIGKSPDKISKAIADKLEVSKNNAKRLVQTESAAIHSGSRKLMYERMGVEKYEILATLDTRTSDICRGLDGKVFEVKDYERGITAPPFHVNCYDKKTEVLTNNGWKYFKDIKNDDYVYTLNLDTKMPKWQKPIKLINYKYKGKMIKYSNDRFDLLVTPNHNMLVQNMDASVKDKSYKLRQANKIGIKSKNRIPCGIDWIGESKETIELAGKELDIKTYLKFMAYWLSDGSVTKDKGRYKIKIAQCKNDWMWNELKKLPFKKYKCKESILVENNELGEELTKFGKCNKKYIPGIIKTLDRDLIIFFLKEYAKCDGTIKKGKFWKGYQFNDSTSFFTTSNQLATDLGELILKAGGRPSYSLNKCAGNKVKFSNGTYTLNYDVWAIHWDKQIYSWIRYMNVDKSFYYDDFVYCVEVPKYNTLYVRRNGKCCWSGNCRTTTIPYFDDDIQKEIENTRMARDVKTGKSVRVENLTYKDWFDRYVNGENPKEKIIVNSIKPEEKGYIKNKKTRDKNGETPKTLQSFNGYQEKWTSDVIKQYLDDDQIEVIGNYFKDLINDNEYSMRVDSKILEKIIDSNKFKTQFETGTSNGALNFEYRKKATKQLFGTGKKRLKADEYEKYGYLGAKDFITDRHSVDASQYGNCIIHFDKSYLKNKVTYTADDSLGLALGNLNIAGNADMPSANGIRKDYLTKIYNEISNNLKLNLEEFLDETSSRYIELQYHGDLKADYIKEVCFIDEKPDDILIEKLKKKNIKVFRMIGDYDNEKVFEI